MPQRTERPPITFGGTTLLRQRKYTVLLAVLIAVLVFQSFSITTRSEGIGHDVIATVFGVAIFLVVFERSAVQTVMGVFLLIADFNRVGTPLARLFNFRSRASSDPSGNIGKLLLGCGLGDPPQSFPHASNRC